MIDSATRERVLDQFAKEPATARQVAQDLGLAPIEVAEVVTEQHAAFTCTDGRYHLTGRRLGEPLCRIIVASPDGEPFEIFTRHETGQWSATGDPVGNDDELSDLITDVVHLAMGWASS